VPKWVVIAILVVVLLIGGLVAGGVALFGSILHMMDRADSHVCGLAFVQKSPAAIAMRGTPIVQHGLTRGSTSTDNGDTSERLTFTVQGPKGQAFVVAAGNRSPLTSHLLVQIGRNGTGTTVYDGPFDCPALHAKRKSGD